MTFSLIARCQATGQMGVAVASHALAVGRTVPWAMAGVGVVATQAIPGAWYGPQLLDDMKGGEPPQVLLENRLSSDTGESVRQIIALDHQGRVAAHSGKRCVEAAGVIKGEEFAAAGNMLVSRKVLECAVDLFAKSCGTLGSRLLSALAAGETEGGDLRGPQAAALIVVGSKVTGDPARDTLTNLRVDDHRKPIRELERLLRLAEADTAWRGAVGNVFAGTSEYDEAIAQIRVAQGKFEDNLEPTFWEAVVLSAAGREREAVELLKTIGLKNPGWLEMFNNLDAAGMISRTP